MYAVFSQEGLVFLGHCKNQAHDALEAKDGSALFKVESLQELEAIFDKNSEKQSYSEAISDTFGDLTDKLDKLGLNKDLADKIRHNSEKMVGEVKSLGVKGMKTVGEGFVALGELMSKAADEDKENNTSCCE